MEVPQVQYTETIIDVIVVLQHQAQTIQRVQMMVEVRQSHCVDRVSDALWQCCARAQRHRR